MTALADLEARRAKLAARLALLDGQTKAARQAATARQAAASRREDAHRKIVVAGALMVLLRAEPALRDYMTINLAAHASARDREAVEAFLAAAGTTKN